MNSTPKFNCTILTPDTPTAELFVSLLETSKSLEQIECLTEYPTFEALQRMLRLGTMDLLLIDCRDLPPALKVIETVQHQSPHIELLAICEEDVKVLSSLLRAGLRDYIPTGSTASAMRETLANTIEKMERKPKKPKSGGDIVTFLPSKPGSGTSTIAAHTAFAASMFPEKRVLLVDFDRDAPMQGFLNRLHPEHYLQEALANAHQMDGDIWTRLVSQRGALDILPADADGAAGGDSGRTHDLLNFFRRAYDLTCVDLPGPLDSGSTTLLLEAKRVYLVCTQELASVHIALRKAERLKRLGIGNEMRVLLNRHSTGHVMTAERVADLVGLPVELTIPNSYSLAAASAENGSYVDADTPLGKSYGKLAQLLLNERVEVPRRQRKFLEFIYQPFLKQGGESAA